MITFVERDLFATGADCLVNTVNCEGFMSKGIAYQFKQRYPLNNEEYIKACHDGTMHIGKVLCCRENGITIINFPTKDKWRRPSTMEYIEKGLESMIQELPYLNVNTIAIPPLGCGNGGLAWDKVRELIVEKLRPLEQYNFMICQPGNSTIHQIAAEKDPSSKSIVLLHIEEHLERFNMTRVLCSCAFVNHFCKREVFPFGSWHAGPTSNAVRDEANKIKAYKASHSFTSKEAYNSIYLRICSKRTDSLITRTEAAVDQAVKIVNAISDDRTLVTATAILHLLSKDNRDILRIDVHKNRDLIISMVGDVSDDVIQEAAQILIDFGMINVDLCGALHLNK